MLTTGNQEQTFIVNLEQHITINSDISVGSNIINSNYLSCFIYALFDREN